MRFERLARVSLASLLWVPACLIFLLAGVGVICSWSVKMATSLLLTAALHLIRWRGILRGEDMSWLLNLLNKL